MTKHLTSIGEVKGKDMYLHLNGTAGPQQKGDSPTNFSSVHLLRLVGMSVGEVGLQLNTLTRTAG